MSISFGFPHRNLELSVQAAMAAMGVAAAKTWPVILGDMLAWSATDKGLARIDVQETPFGAHVTFVPWRQIGEVGVRVSQTTDTHEPTAQLRVPKQGIELAVPRAVAGTPEWDFVQAVLDYSASA
ncbi:MAG TPA: hypothetical protein VKR24_03370 [Candidatus Limnocylindrales bacterium]|nr:hypothetical protein [Candidatus Limnocylindrales bacterium]